MQTIKREPITIAEVEAMTSKEKSKMFDAMHEQMMAKLGWPLTMENVLLLIGREVDLVKVNTMEEMEDFVSGSVRGASCLDMGVLRKMAKYYNFVIDIGPIIHDIYDDPNVGVEEWYNVFISSPEYTRLNPSDRRKAFRIISDLKMIIDDMPCER